MEQTIRECALNKCPKGKGWVCCGDCEEHFVKKRYSVLRCPESMIRECKLDSTAYYCEFYNSLAGTKNPMEQAIERMKNRK